MVNPYVFGRLHPANDLAEKAFDHIAHKIKTNPQHWNPFARQYIKINAEKSCVFNYTSDTESEGGSGPVSVASTIWRGHYCLAFDIPPANPRRGWIVGGGNFGTAEIVLTEKKKQNHISSQHATFAHNYTSGALVLTVSENNTVIMDGKEVRNEQRTIWSPETRLTFGRLDYKLILEPISNQDHITRLTHYKTRHGIKDEEYPFNLMPTPAETDYMHKDYIFKNPIGHGGSSIVFAGEHRKTGAAVAIKKFKRTRENWGSIRREIAMAEYLGNHPRICKLIDLMSPDLDPEGLTFRQSGVDEMYLIFSPLALGTVEGLIQGQQPADAESKMIKIFWQYLDGIDYIHEQGVIHRDVKPANMSVVSLNPPRAKLIDFGSAIKSTSSDHSNVGTKMYHAPEIWRLAKGNTLRPFGKAVDMFAFGLSAYRLFCGQYEWWHPEADAQVLKAIAGHLTQRTSNAPLMNLIAKCLVEDPQQRTTARQAKTYPGIPYAPGDREEVDTLAYGIASLNVDGRSSQRSGHLPHGSSQHYQGASRSHGSSHISHSGLYDYGAGHWSLAERDRSPDWDYPQQGGKGKGKTY